MRIRPIQPDELPVFAGAATHSEHVGAVHDYVSDLLIKGSMRTELTRSKTLGRIPQLQLLEIPQSRDLLRLRGNLQPGATGSRDAARRQKSGPRRRAGRGHGRFQQPRLPAAAPVCPPARGAKAAGSPHRRAARRVYPRHFPVTSAPCRRCWGHSSVCKKLYIKGC
jgi:hypothetical protein